MKKSVKNLLFGIILIYLGINPAFSQITTNEEPFSFRNNTKARNLLSSLKTNLELPALDVAELLKQDSVLESTDKLVRTSISLPVNINAQTSGKWLEMENGDLLWQYKIIAKGAKSLDITFDKFWLPDKGKFFVYNSSTSQYIGAITSEYLQGNQNKPANFSTAQILGDEIVLEYYQPSEVEAEPVISVDRVYYGYKQFSYEFDSNVGASGSCNINICDYYEWELVGEATARVLIKLPDAAYWCSGALVNTTAQDYHPFFLTADHCLCGFFDAVNNKSASTWVFYWDFAKKSTGWTIFSSAPTTIGANVVANDSRTDFALMELIQDPKKDYYLGWDVTGTTGNDGVCIHYPKGDSRKISLYKGVPTSTMYLNTNLNSSGTHWKLKWATGVTEGGSSGSPLINSDKKIVGQLHGGNTSCSNTRGDDWFGKLSESWKNSNATDPRRRLKDWLDPLNTNTLKLDSKVRPWSGRGRSNENVLNTTKDENCGNYKILCSNGLVEVIFAGSLDLFNGKRNSIRYELFDSMTGIKCDSGEFDIKGTVLNFTKVKKGIYILSLVEKNVSCSHKIIL